MSKQLDFFTTHGSESQILMVLNTLKVDISKQENDFQTLIPCYECSYINFKASGIKSALNSLGSVEIKSVPCSISYKPSKHTQAQIPSAYEKMTKKFKLENKFKVPCPGGRVSSFVVTNDNRLLLCDSADKRRPLSIWSETGDHIQDCAIAGTAWGIAIIPETMEAVVTLPDMHSVQFVNIKSMVPGNVIDVAVKPRGVTCVKDMLVLGGIGKVYFLSMTGSLKKTFDVGSGYLYSLNVNKTDMIYCCEPDKDTLHCIDINGTVIFSYTSPAFKRPINISFDGKENVYVVTWQSHKLHRLSPDGKLLDIPLKGQDGLNEPFAIAFNNNHTKLYISNGRGIRNKEVWIFDCA